jgi:alpha-L-glutamate ligase-like protein
MAERETWWRRARWLRQNVLGLNRRNQDYILRFNPPRLVALVDHKVRTKEVLAEHGIAVPATFVRCASTRGLALMAEELGRHPEFVLKPARGAGGDGIVVIAGRDGDHLVKASGTRLTMRDLLAHAADVLAGAYSLSQTHDEVLVEQRLKPDASLSPYCPAGVPDLRVLMAFGVPLLAMLRLPTIGSEGRANLHVGGIGVGIDLASGAARYAICRDRPVEVHPDTGQPLCEVRIPNWPEVLLTAVRSYDAIPLGYLGVDIVIDDRFGPVILELNARPGLSIQLANRCALRPLLAALPGEEEGDRERSSPERRVEMGVALSHRVRAGDEAYTG